MRNAIVLCAFYVGVCSGACGAPSGSVQFTPSIVVGGGGGEEGGRAGAPQTGGLGAGGTLAPSQGENATGGVVPGGSGGVGGRGFGGTSGGRAGVGGDSTMGGMIEGGIGGASAGEGGAPTTNAPPYPSALNARPYSCVVVESGHGQACGGAVVLRCVTYDGAFGVNGYPNPDRCWKAGTTQVPQATWVCCQY